MSDNESIEIFLEKNKRIHAEFLVFLDNEGNSEENFNNLKKMLDETKIRDYQHDIRLFLHMIVKVANRHHHGREFYSKIFRVLRLFTEDIKKYQNSRIFSIFNGNKRILLFLIEEKILAVDEYFVKQIIENKYLMMKYPQYFAPEIRPFMNEKWFPKYVPNSRANKKEKSFPKYDKIDDDEEEERNKNELVEDLNKELPDDFIELRRIGENDSYISKLIREDLVEDFIIYVNKNCISRNATINQSIYETNSFLINFRIHLIEYAAFFGSTQIFTYLKNENVELTSSLWLFIIHGRNAELIHLLEDNHLNQPVTDIQPYRKYLKESIKCNHIEIMNYFLDNFLQDKDEHSKDIIILSLKYYNFSFLQNENIDESSFCHLCYFDYYSLVYNLLLSRNIDANVKLIQNHIFQ